MFERYFGFKSQPFGVTPDPKFLYWTKPHQEALASLYYGIESGCGFMTLISPPGMGKTTLLFHLLERLRGTARTAYIFQTQCSSNDFLRHMMADLGWNAREQDLVTLYTKLYELLVADANAGKRFVLVVDEAQNLDDSVLETVRLLTNFETPNRKLMQVILAGQPQLSSKLERLDLWQLRQRISIMGRLEPLTPPEVAEYVQHRLTVVGYKGAPIFTPRALDLIAAASGGIPRIINNLCFNALSLACAQRQKKIEVTMLREVAADLGLGIPADTEETQSLPQQPSSPPEESPPLAQKPDLGQIWGVMTAWAANHRNLGVGVVVAALIIAGMISISYMNRQTHAVDSDTEYASANSTSGDAESWGMESQNFSRLGTRQGAVPSIRYMTIIVRPDENLSLVTLKYLGKKLDQRMLENILLLNPQITDPHKMEAGKRVRLPLAASRVATLPVAFQQGTGHEPQ